MGRRCEICGKGTISGNNVSHSHIKTRRKWKINLSKVKVKWGDSIKLVKICSRCLRTGKIEKAI